MGAAATLFFAFALPPVLHDVQALITELPTRGPQLLDQLHQIPVCFSHQFFRYLNAKLQGFASNFAEYLFLSISGWAGKLADIGAVIFLTIYFMLEGDEAYHWVLSFFPKSARGRLNDTLLRADVRMGKWLLGQGGLMLILGLCSLIVFVLLKVRYAYALAVLMGALEHHSHRGRDGLDGPGVAGGGHRFLGEGGGRGDFLRHLRPGGDFLPDAAHHEEQRRPSCAGGPGRVADGFEAGRA